ncbi:glycosyl transferase [Tabrizicola sp. TH137]|uniref:glycosyltransferase family 2 protein n=1 Tax=Tabrizicola sp. TH137 TaxID=2067452 RepID=UPI000C7CC0A6|nr:glycosyltransferase family 2 protein [Tabrizicola sp. TH137]PLL12719.1 glycosyl transferase [Tabrizicola sp. TH137]
MTPTVSCLIPAWNEAARIGAVLAATRAHPLLTETLVIDDGSTDATARIAAHHGATVLRQRVNGGKSAAVARGLAVAQGEIILLLDADLQGLTPDDITALLAPLRDGRAKASLSLRRNAPLPWRLIGLDYISGERAMPRALLLPHLDRIARLRGFGLEVFLNDLWIAEDLPLAVIPLAIDSPAKAAKHGLLRGLRGDLRMLADILRVAGPLRPLRQIAALVAAARAARRRGRLSSGNGSPGAMAAAPARPDAAQG